MVHFYDTSAILNCEDGLEENAYISPLTLTELEHIKTSVHKDAEVKKKARDAVRALMGGAATSVVNSNLAINFMIATHPFLRDIPDHRIVCDAVLFAKKTKQTIHFITADAAQSLFAKRFDCLDVNFLPHTVLLEQEEMQGWREFELDDEKLASLYSDATVNTLNAPLNEYCKIIHNGEVVDVVRWDGTEYKILKYEKFRSPLGETIAPRSMEQEMFFDLLQDEKRKVKICLGRMGSGKSFIMLMHALRGIEKGKFDKIVFVRNNIGVADSNDIGYLSGDMNEKMAPWLASLRDHLGIDMFEAYMQEGKIESLPLVFARGRDLRYSCIFVDEAQNLTPSHCKLLLGRCGEGSEIYMAGDLKSQIDKQIFEKNNGIRKMISSLKNNKLFGYVRLMKSERSDVCALADELD